MKPIKFTLICATVYFLSQLQPVYGQTGVAIAATTSTADPSAMLDIQSTSKGALVPRMTNSQRTSITTPANGLLVFCTDAPSGFYYNSGTSSSPTWVILSAGALTGTGTTDYEAMWTSSGTLGTGLIYNSGTNVGIGTSGTPASMFSVGGTTGNFQVSSGGAIGAATGITSGGTITFSGLGSTAGVVLNSSAGVLSSTAGALPIANGGTAATTAVAALTSLGAAPASGSANYIQNGTTLQTASFNISGTGYIASNVGIGCINPQTLLEVRNGTNDILKVSSTIGGSGNACNIAFTTYSGTGIGARISAIDDGSYGAHLSFQTTNTGTTNRTTTTERMRITNAGKVGIGQTAPASYMDVEAANNGNTSNVITSADYISYFYNKAASYGGAILANVSSNQNNCRYMECEVNGAETGCLYGNGSNVLSVYSASDERLKKNIRNTSLGLSTVMQMKVRDYEWKADNKTVNAGFIAQELYKVYPEAVSKGSDGDMDSKKGGTWMVNYAGITPLLVKAIQDQQKIIEEQKSQIGGLQSDVDKLKASVETLQQIISEKAEK